MRPTSMRRVPVALTVAAALFLAACQGDSATSAAASDDAADGTAAPTAAALPNGAAAAAAAGGGAPEPTAAADDSSALPDATATPPQAISRRDWAEIGAGESLYDPWARALAGYVDEEGLVDYAGLAGPGRGDLEAFMSTLGSTDPSGFSESDQIAFWINAYNATTVNQAVQRYPIESVRDVGVLFGLVGGFFKQSFRVANEDRTLDNIEHDILRPTYNDARIHWTLVCAAFGCPRLLRRPYVGADLDPLLTELSFEFMANPRALHIDDASGTLWVSSYFDWYGGDFEAESGNIVDYILRYAPDDKATWIRAHRDTMSVRFMDYDWTLNDQPKGPRSRRPIDPS